MVLSIEEVNMETLIGRSGFASWNNHSPFKAVVIGTIGEAFLLVRCVINNNKYVIPSNRFILVN
jgi:hypothetical protein